MALAVLCIAGCGSDGPTGGAGDTTPPGIASVTALDVQHVRVVFTETVDRQSAEAPGHYRIVEGTPPVAATAAPGDETPISAAVLDSDGRTVGLTTGTPMQQLSYDLHVTGVQDGAGNAIIGDVTSSFTGTTAPDVTPPTIVDRAPAPNSTGVPIGLPVRVQFSESMDYSSVLAAFHWDPASGPRTVNWTATSDDNALFVFTASEPLTLSMSYTVTVGAEAMDRAGNHFAGTTWSYQTTSETDNTPPALSSSTPADGATRVPLTTNLSLTFTEPIIQVLDQILLSPEIGNGSLQWSNGGRTFTFDPDVDLLTDTQYSLLIPPSGITDLAGNPNTGVIAVVFTTGNAIATGSFAGTLSGDPRSSVGSNPQGAIVVAADRSPFVSDNFGIAGHAVVGSGGGYDVRELPNATFWPFAVMETNGDGRISPEYGDAFGAYGVDFAAQTGEPDSVTISGGSRITGVNFALFDPVALAGRVVYAGSAYTGCCYNYYVGVFDTTGFNPNDLPSLNPAYSTGGSLPYEPQWWVNQLDHGLQPGTYYVGAYLDANSNSVLDVSDPLGVYASAGVPIPLAIDNGADILDITIALEDPVPGSWRSTPVNWQARSSPVAPERRAMFRRVVELMQRAAPQAQLDMRR